MLAWTESLYSGPSTNVLLPSPGPSWTPWGSGSLSSKLPRIPFFNTGSLYTLVWGLKVTYCFWMTFCWFWALNAGFGLSPFFWRIDSRSTSTPSTWGQGTTGLNWSAMSLLGRLGCKSLPASRPAYEMRQKVRQSGGDKILKIYIYIFFNSYSLGCGTCLFILKSLMFFYIVNVRITYVINICKLTFTEQKELWLTWLSILWEIMLKCDQLCDIRILRNVYLSLSQSLLYCIALFCPILKTTELWS